MTVRDRAIFQSSFYLRKSISEAENPTVSSFWTPVELDEVFVRLRRVRCDDEEMDSIVQRHLLGKPYFMH